MESLKNTNSTFMQNLDQNMTGRRLKPGME